ncbi:carboxymuconolactone decarboxylase family protein [Enterovirga rhinocerotis]|uniref:Putative peroxidase-related enzyme n=1 Tax=Enterovirga rhinocerotis TaxID=1339210 RepID=A0A4R7BMB4_9HYPH|nr:carboxymuconolactone decarboxylase family protein [Enterovirga rhinocerotis]TDR85415.1 putative peroxidase-related enzyme [Enterovirga rhinocerotis]
MARVRDIDPSELQPDLAAIHQRYLDTYGPFASQAAVLAHVPAALRHLPPLLMELREAKTLSKRYLEIAIVVVSKLNECHYCVAMHKPFLTVEGLSPQGIDGILAYRDHPELDEVDRLVAEYSEVAWTTPNRVSDALFARLREHFSEAQIVELTLRITLCGFFNRFSEALRIDD